MEFHSVIFQERRFFPRVNLTFVSIHVDLEDMPRWIVGLLICMLLNMFTVIVLAVFFFLPEEKSHENLNAVSFTVLFLEDVILSCWSVCSEFLLFALSGHFCWLSLLASPEEQSQICSTLPHPHSVLVSQQMTPKSPGKCQGSRGQGTLG